MFDLFYSIKIFKHKIWSTTSNVLFKLFQSLLFKVFSGNILIIKSTIYNWYIKNKNNIAINHKNIINVFY